LFISKKKGIFAKQLILLQNEKNDNPCSLTTDSVGTGSKL
jgi:hypothetical protein